MTARPAGRRRLPVLTYHSIDGSGSPISIAPIEFERQMAELAGAGWRTLSVDEARAGLDAGAWPVRSFLLTFDDGYGSVLERAAPVLARHGFQALLFVISGCVGATSRWAGQPAWVPDAPLLDWPALRELAASGWRLGAHSRTHPRLTDLPPGDAEREVVLCRREIEDRCAVPVTAFAYPYGLASPAVERLAAEHYRLAFGARLSFVTARSRASCLERIDAYYLRGRPLHLLDGPVARGYLACRALARRLRHSRIGR